MYLIQIYKVGKGDYSQTRRVLLCKEHGEKLLERINGLFVKEEEE